MGLLRAFDPSYAHMIDSNWIQSLSDLHAFACIPSLDTNLQQELPIYLAAAQGFVVNRADVKEFNMHVLNWWACNRSKNPYWAMAARITFSLTPSSASCERVFSLLKCMFGHLQSASLADQVQAALMLRYNERKC
mmetsp:Transcript_2703/g.7883  ORF Transcript_2703/g.7883 Transcript_2703/m.7883 type:complete len:135 (+) Transcript_2703:445-849(+)